MKRIFDLRRADAHIVVVISAPQRVEPVGTKRHPRGRARGGAAQRRLERDRTAFDARFVADLDIPARQAGIAAHGAAVFLGGFVNLQHRLDDERRQVALFGIGAAAQTGEIIVGISMAAFAIKSSAVRWMDDIGIMDRLYSAASRNTVSPGFTCVNRTGRSVMSIPPDVCRATVKVEVAKSPGSGKSDRKCAPREFSRRSAASAITRLTSHSERRLSQSCQVRLKRRSASATPIERSSASIASTAAMPR